MALMPLIKAARALATEVANTAVHTIQRGIFIRCAHGSSEPPTVKRTCGEFPFTRFGGGDTFPAR